MAWLIAMLHHYYGKLRNMGVEFSGTGSKAIQGYMDRVFSRDSFLQSVGEAAL